MFLPLHVFQWQHLRSANQMDKAMLDHPGGASWSRPCVAHWWLRQLEHT